VSTSFRATPADGVVWITGASSGIGRATALEFARRGFTVVATARRLDQLEALCAEPDAAGLIRAEPGDVTDPAAMTRIVEGMAEKHGPLAIAFLNAGTYFPDKGVDFDADLVKRTFDINIGGTANCLEPVLRVMKRRGKGQVGVNASVAGYVGLPRSAAYGPSKAALINMCASLRFALEPAGITMQVISPGFVGTPLTAKNDFPMPFMIPAEDAARRICDGFARAGFEITFPRRLSWLLKAINLLPYRLYFPLVGSATRER
jgi:NAD(P)-dependent dehydrogenase (short-subunit alcohol dehydrogenase family)